MTARSYLSYLIILFSSLSCIAQVEWLETEYDYGTFREAAGPQKGSVRFVNKGNEPTFINSVRPSCGCTAAAYTESMIQPGDTATVSFIYNPYGRPGKFDKTVKVFLGKENLMKIVKIRGTVIGEPETLKSSYPYSAGPLRLEKQLIPVGDIKKGSSRHIFLNVYNQSEDTISPSWVNDNRAVEVELTPRNLAPGDIGTLGFYLRTPLEKNMGPVEYPVMLTADSNDPHSEKRELKISAKIIPNPNEAKISSLENSGHLYLPQETVDLGDVVGDGKRKFRFEIVNDGSQPLEVLRIYTQNKAVKVKNVNGKIKGGGRKMAEGALDAKDLPSGPFRINVEIMTDDPLNPIRSVKVVGIREK
ncbi:MAG: DUF1573 domain-containing protein [Muribaculaceae bacterium]|nr:DUF1573 domain-containing protein [Muribaculaceae bacterium]